MVLKCQASLISIDLLELGKTLWLKKTGGIVDKMYFFFRNLFLIIFNMLFISLNQCFDKPPSHHYGDSTSTWVKYTLSMYTLLEVVLTQFILTNKYNTLIISISMCLLTF